MGQKLAQGIILQRGTAAVTLVLGLVVACSPKLDLAEIRSYQQAGRFAETIEPLRARLDETPDDPELNHLYGLALLETNQAALAIWPLRKSADDPERAVDDGLLLVRAILEGGSPEDAVEVASHVLELAPDRADVLRLKISARVKARQNEAALEDVDRLLELKPGDPGALMSRLVAELSLDRAEDAEQTLKEIREAATSVDGGVEWEPRICGGTATFLKEKGDLEEAEALWNDCLEQFPTDEMIVFSGVEFFGEISKPARASEILRRAYDTEPTHLPFVEALANRLGRAGQTQEAERILLAATTDGVNDRRAWFALSDFYERRDDPTKAAEAMAKGLSLMGDAPPMMVAEYVDLLIRAGDYDRADELIASFESEPMISNLLAGRLLLARGKAAEALEKLQEGLRVWPDNSVARELVAQAYEQLGEYDRAVIEYAESMRSDPGNRDALFPLVRLLRALDRDPEAIAVVERYLGEKRGDPESLLLLIQLAASSGQQGRLDMVTRKLNENPAYRGALVAELAAIRAAREGAAAGAEYIRRSKIDLTRPIHGPVLRALVGYLIAAGKPAEALQSADAALAAAPEEPLFVELRAQALRAAGKDAEARESYDRALALEPARASALAGLAALTAAQGDRPAAIALYDRAAQADPAESSYAWAAIQLVVASGDDAEVARRLDALLIRDPIYSQALVMRASQLRSSDPERAFSLARRAVRLHGGPEALVLLGRIQLERGNPQQATELLRRCVALQPDQPSAHYWLGMALIATGDREGAQAELTTALQAESFPEREDAQLELARLSGSS